MDHHETMARELCRAYGMEPDELIQRLPAGRPMPAWQHFSDLAAATSLWLRMHSKPANEP